MTYDPFVKTWVPIPPKPPEPSREEVLLSNVLQSLAQLQTALANLPAPVVNVDSADLSEIVTAVNGLKGPQFDPEDLAQAIKNALAPTLKPRGSEANLEPALSKITEALEKLDFRMKGQGFGGGAVTLAPGTQLTANITGFSTETTLDAVKSLTQDIKRSVTDFESRLDYDGRTDGNAVYVGKNTNGRATSASDWSIQKLTYDSSNRLTRAQVLTGAWDNRTTLAW